MFRWCSVGLRFDVLLQQGWLRPVGRQVLIVAAVLLGAALLLLAVNYDHLRHSYALHEKTDATFLMIDRTEAKLVGVEMTTRGYALTRDTSFLAMQSSERRDLLAQWQQLDAALSDEPAQKVLFGQLRPLIQRRLNLYAYLSTPAHAAEVAHAITDPATRQVMRDAQSALGRLRLNQLVLLKERQEAMSVQVRTTAAMTAIIILLAFAGVVLGIVMTMSGNIKSSP
ncbi:MAG: CHASE3 domain-containing protein [Rhizomicrobium sp.]